MAIAAQTPQTTCCLSQVPVGTCAIIESISPDAEPELVCRLAHLGLTPGTEIQVERVAPLKDPTVYRCRNISMCLRAAHTRNIRVRTV